MSWGWVEVDGDGGGKLELALMDVMELISAGLPQQSAALIPP